MKRPLNRSRTNSPPSAAELDVFWKTGASLLRGYGKFVRMISMSSAPKIDLSKTTTSCSTNFTPRLNETKDKIHRFRKLPLPFCSDFFVVAAGRADPCSVAGRSCRCRTASE